MTFKAWMQLQRKRDDPVGDLARHILQDRKWPSTQDMVKLRQYLVKQSVAEKAVSALERAYAEYQKQGNRLRPPDIG